MPQISRHLIGLAADMTDIHDIKSPVAIGWDPGVLYYFMAIIAAVLVLAALIYILFKFIKRKKTRREILPEPHETAYFLLDELLDTTHIEGKDFYFRLSAIFRNYLKGRYYYNAPEMTSEELVPEIDRLSLPGDLRKSIREWLQYADLIKFANVYAVESRMSAHLSLVRRFIDATTPQPVED